MNFKTFSNGVVLRDYSKHFENCQLKAYLTTRIANANSENCLALNFANHISPEQRAENIAKIQACLPAKKRRLYLKQIHSKNIIVDDGKANLYLGEGDGLISKYDDVLLQTMHADCLPVYAAVENSDYFGIAHSGRAGCYQEIARHLVEQLCQLAAKQAAQVKVLIGAGIDREHYQVNQAIYQDFFAKFGDKVAYQIDDKYYLNLQNCILNSLSKAGVPPENIAVDKLSTYQSEDYFHSYRRDGEYAGRMLALICKN